MNAPIDDVRAAANGSNAFGADLYARLKTQPGNLVFSPASITLAFGMTEAGARADTAQELRRAFHFGLPEPRLHAALGTLARTWNHTTADRFELATANRLYGQTGWPFTAGFRDITAREYAAPLETVDFRANPDAERRRINGWVSERTRTRIQDLLPPQSIVPDTRLVLVNAVYLHARWQDEFERNATRDEAFHVNGASATVNVPTMHHNESYRTVSRDGYRVIELPYSESGYVFDIVMPDALDGIAALENRWQAATPAAFFEGLSYARVMLALPKFRVAPADSTRLSRELRALGVTHAFDRTTADFTGIAPFQDPADRLCISEAFHKAFVQVDEQGTEAAAATAVVMMRAGSAPAQPIPFVVDRPFLFFLRDTNSGAILFAGRVVDPRS